LTNKQNNICTIQSCGLMHISSLHIIHMLYVILFSSHCISLYYSLSQLTQLQILAIGHNLLNTVPDVVSSLTSLKQLYMSSCRISSLPERFVCHMFITTSHHNCLPFNYIMYTQFIVYKIIYRIQSIAIISVLSLSSCVMQ